MFDVCVYDDAGEEHAEGDGERFVERPLERVPPLGVARAPLHGRHALGEVPRAALAQTGFAAGAGRLRHTCV